MALRRSGYSDPVKRGSLTDFAHSHSQSQASLEISIRVPIERQHTYLEFHMATRKTKHSSHVASPSRDHRRRR